MIGNAYDPELEDVTVTIEIRRKDVAVKTTYSCVGVQLAKYDILGLEYKYLLKKIMKAKPKKTQSQGDCS